MSSRPETKPATTHTASGAVDAGSARTDAGPAKVQAGRKRRRLARRSKHASADPAVFARPTGAAATQPHGSDVIEAAKRASAAETTQPLHTGRSARGRTRRSGVSALDFLPSLTTFFVLAHFAAVAVLLYLFVL